MTTFKNVMVLAIAVVATFAVGMAGADTVGLTATNTFAKRDRIVASTMATDAFVTIEHRGPQMSILSRVPAALLR